MPREVQANYITVLNAANLENANMFLEYISVHGCMHIPYLQLSECPDKCMFCSRLFLPSLSGQFRSKQTQQTFNNSTIKHPTSLYSLAILLTFPSPSFAFTRGFAILVPRSYCFFCSCSHGNIGRGHVTVM